MGTTTSTRFRTCNRCQRTGLVWYQRRGRWVLAEPLPGTEQADVGKLHSCFAQPVLSGEGKARIVNSTARVTRAFKPSEFRRRSRKRA